MPIEDPAIPFDFHCMCGHIAASHWYTTIIPTAIISGRCVECPMKYEEDVCKGFKPDNLVHLEKLHDKKEKYNVH